MENLQKKIESKDAVIGIVGLGYVGLPLAIAFAECGFTVVGYDKDETKINKLRMGESYLNHVNSDEFTSLGMKLNFATTPDGLLWCDAFIVCVPTPLRENREPDLSCIIDAAIILMMHAKPGRLFVLESSTYPGTTRDIFANILLEDSGLVIGENVFVAHSPERQDPGNPKFKTKNVPKVVGGLTENCLRVASCLYRQVIETVVDVKTAETAEMVKLFENTYRMINIALVNEMKLLCEGMKIDIWDVVDAAASKPFGFQSFKPGPGLGGHCFAAGTSVATENGPLPIECVEVGMMVLTEEYNGGGHRKVLHTFEREYAGEMILIQVDTMPEVLVTPEHEVYAIEKSATPKSFKQTKKIPAKKLIPGKHCVLWPIPRGNLYLDILSAATDYYEGKVYNLHVEKTNRYVTSLGLVSNCIPVDPFYLTWKARQFGMTTKFIELAGEINSKMPTHVVSQVMLALNSQKKAVNGANILVLGVAYKSDVNDIRESPALAVIRMLLQQKAFVLYHDPYIPVVTETNLKGLPSIRSVSLTEEIVKNSDAVVVLTDHSNVDYDCVAKFAKIIVDSRNVKQLRDQYSGDYWTA